MRKVSRTFFWWVLLFNLAQAAAWAGDPRLTPLSQIRPTQTDIGEAHVAFSVDKIHSLTAVRGGLLNTIASRSIPAVIGPDGKFYITDAHHWASAVLRIQKERPDLADQIRLNLSITADFSGKSWAECAKYMYANNVGYFSPDIRAKYEVTRADGSKYIPEDKLEELYRTYLPADLTKLKDNPGRSIVGIAVEQMGFKTDENSIDYVEFYGAEIVGAQMKAAGIDFSKLTDPKKIDAALIERASKVLVTDPTFITFLLNSTRPQMPVGDARRNLLEAINRYRHDVLKLPPVRVRASAGANPVCVADLKFLARKRGK